MERIISNDWRPERGVQRAEILAAPDTVEGFDVARYRADAAGEVSLPTAVGHYVTAIDGQARLQGGGEVLSVDRGTHLYVPAGYGASLGLEPGAQLVVVSAERPEQAVGEDLRVRHERFLSACAVDGHCLRWILTPQYLSRRVFLHHDAPLRSREGRPVSWFRTTMFDVAGLPANADGEPVFRMSYDTRTEFNVCYDVRGHARVRFARHPYVDEGQRWSEWKTLDSDSTYYLDEAAGGPDEETYVDGEGRQRTLRNRHEVSATGGHCSLLCLFDPAPTGIEKHRPGAYSDYEAYEDVSKRPEHTRHVAALGPFDEMVEALSLARARGALASEEGSEHWKRYLDGRAEQRRIESALAAELAAEGQGRDAVIAPWMLPDEPQTDLP